MELVSLVGLSGVLYPFSAFSSERMYEPKHGVSKVRMVALIWSESGLGLCGTMQVLFGDIPWYICARRANALAGARALEGV